MRLTTLGSGKALSLRGWFILPLPIPEGLRTNQWTLYLTPLNLDFLCSLPDPDHFNLLAAERVADKRTRQRSASSGVLGDSRACARESRLPQRPLELQQSPLLTADRLEL